MLTLSENIHFLKNIPLFVNALKLIILCCLACMCAQRIKYKQIDKYKHKL